MKKIILAILLLIAFPVYAESPYPLAVSSGEISGAAPFYSIGERAGVAVTATGDDIWRGTATTIPIPDQTNGEQMTVVSTSANDAAAGTGVRSIHIAYLDANWNEMTEIVTLNGTSAVDTVATGIKFVNHIHTATAGSGALAAGVIKIYKKGDASTVYNLIDIGGNMSLTVSRMIPAGKTFYLYGWQCSTTAGKPTFVRIRSTDFDGVLHGHGETPHIFIFKDPAATQDSTYVKNFPFPVKIPSKSIIKVTAWATQANGNVAASFDGVMFGN